MQDEKRDEFIYKVAQENNSILALQGLVVEETSLGYDCLKHKQSLIINNKKNTNAFIDARLKAALFVPLLVNEEIIGFISIALENTRFYQKVQYTAQYDSLTKVLNR